MVAEGDFDCERDTDHDFELCAKCRSREKAKTLLNQALETYTQIGMPRHIEMTQTLLGQATGT